jgi:hypothetical protein
MYFYWSHRWVFGHVWTILPYYVAICEDNGVMIFLIGNQFEAQFLLRYVYLNPLHVSSLTPRPFFIPGKDPVPVVPEAGGASGLVWTGAENLAPTGIWSPDRPARSQSLYLLSYPAHICIKSSSKYLHSYPQRMYLLAVPIFWYCSAWWWRASV